MDQSQASIAGSSVVQGKLDELLHSLSRILGIHRELIEVIRTEKSALIAANLEATEDCLFRKEDLVSQLSKAERGRRQICSQLYALLRLPEADHRLSQVAVAIQGVDPKKADKLRSIQNALKVLIDRIKIQNLENMSLVEESLHHLQQMKKNVLGESNPMTRTYNRSKKTEYKGESRMVSKEV